MISQKNAKLIVAAGVGLTLIIGVVIAYALSNAKAPRGGKFNNPNPGDPYAVVIPEKALPVTSNFVKHLKNGGAVEVVLDACPFDDTGWLKTGDPLGNLKCGETYEVRYNPENLKWYGRGLEEYRSQLEGRDFIGTRNMNGSSIKRGELFIWGVRFTANEDGTVESKLTAKSESIAVGHFSLK